MEYKQEKGIVFTFNELKTIFPFSIQEAESFLK